MMDVASYRKLLYLELKYNGRSGIGSICPIAH
jgi:hypothetical protein